MGVAAERAASGVIDVATAGTGSVAKTLGNDRCEAFPKVDLFMGVIKITVPALFSLQS